MNNTAFEVTIVFTAYQSIDSAKNAFILVIFLVYAATVLASIVLMIIICSESSLHKPMYIYLFNLVCIGLTGSTSVWPKVMSNLVSDHQTSSYSGCLLQVFLLSFYAADTFVVLAVMAYDRYVSICKPLQYHAIMTQYRVKQLLVVSNLVPVFFVAVQVFLTSRIPVCKYSLPRLFCDNLSVSNLSCGNSSLRFLSNLYGIFVIVSLVVLPLCLILLSYAKIISVSLRVSKDAKRKAISTCTPHLVVFINFSAASVFTVVYNRINSYILSEMNIFVAFQIVLIPPLLHPVIYGIRTKEIRKCFSKTMRRRMSPFAIFHLNSKLQSFVVEDGAAAIPGRDATSRHTLDGTPVEDGDAAAVPGCDAASWDTLDGTPVEVCEYPGIHAKPPRLLEEEDLLSHCLHDHTCVADSSLFVMQLMMVVPSANFMTLSELCGLAVVGEQREQQETEHTSLGGGTSAECQCGGGGIANLHCLCCARQEVQDPTAQEELMHRSRSNHFMTMEQKLQLGVILKASIEGVQLEEKLAPPPRCSTFPCSP
ncbi:olfactory receptor-like protein OLF3 [Chanos chanos]|uniref:Olfactory receptor-like protein OLF3 n=1 Tax=Chanos chanos TaxID=29144 RepID=A0A6J2VNZ5_CHACN|nr:olfactory receptor-like protein OLF3 [Chanos chanos]